jgi:hypothetical protein
MTTSSSARCWKKCRSASVMCLHHAINYKQQA